MVLGNLNVATLEIWGWGSEISGPVSVGDLKFQSQCMLEIQANYILHGMVLKFQNCSHFLPFFRFKLTKEEAPKSLTGVFSYWKKKGHTICEPLPLRAMSN